MLSRRMTSNTCLRRYVAPVTTGTSLIFGLRKLKASETMGIPAPDCPRADGQSSFSEDVFRIEVCGPEKSHFSVIDVPGTFRTTVAKITLGCIGYETANVAAYQTIDTFNIVINGPPYMTNVSIILRSRCDGDDS